MEVVGPNKGVEFFFSLLMVEFIMKPRKRIAEVVGCDVIPKTAVWQTKNQPTNIPLTLVFLLYAQF